jgi:hypothetical protein
MPNIMLETNHAAEFLISEGNGQISRETGAFAAGDALPAGQVLGLVTATNQYAAYDDGESDGSQVAAAILYAPLAESDAVRTGAVIVRLAEVAGELLTGLDDAAKADLAARNIIVR